MAAKKPSIRLDGPQILWDTLSLDPIETPPEVQSQETPERSTMRAAADIGLSGLRGVGTGVRMLTDLAGADNPASGGLRTVDDFLRGLQSARANADEAEVGRIMREAEGKGILDQVIAAGRAFGVAPVSMAVNAAGTAVPTIAAAMTPLGQAAMAGRMTAGAVGAAQGIGATKGSIYDTTRHELLQAGATEQEANQRAAERQSYALMTTGQLVGSAALGALAGGSGIEAIVGGRRMAGGLARRALTGAATEMIPEAAQGGHEKWSANTALAAEGFDVDPMQGVAGSSTLEGLASAPVGAGFGAMSRPPPAPAVEPPIPETGPTTRAANVALATGAAQQSAQAAQASQDEAEAEDRPKAIERDADAALARLHDRVRAEDERHPAAEETAAEPAIAPETPAETYEQYVERTAQEDQGPPREGDTLNAKGDPFKNRKAAQRVADKQGGSAVPVVGGWVVRPIEPIQQAQPGEQDAQPDLRPTAAVAAVPAAGGGDLAGGSGGDLGQRNADAGRPSQAAAAAPVAGLPAPEPVGAADQYPDAVAKPPSVLQLKRAWSAAVERGDTAAATEINDRIVAAKAGLAAAPTTPQQGAPNESQSPQQDRPEGARQDEPALAAGAAKLPDAQGQEVGEGWQAFAPETGTKGIPRAEMPQVKAGDRSALVQYLRARDVDYTEESVDPASLKPTQAEYSPAKVRQARDYSDTDRSILVSSDGHVLDGHHQWLAKLNAGKPIKVIRLDAPIEKLVEQVKEFPSAKAADGATAVASAQSQAGETATREPHKLETPGSTPGPATTETKAPTSLRERREKAIAERASRGAKHPQTVMGSRLLALVSEKLGGLDPAIIADVSERFETRKKGKDGRNRVEWRNPLVSGVGKLFRRGGTQDFQQLAELLEAHGYLDPGSVDADAKDAGEQAIAKVREALNRAEPMTAAEREAVAQASQDAEREDYYRQLDAESAAELEAERQAIMSEHEITPADMAGVTDDDIAFDWPSNPTEAIHAVTQAPDEQGAQDRADEDRQDAGQGQDAATETRSAAPGAAEEGLTDPFKLDKQELNRQLNAIVAADDAPDLLRAFTVLRKRYANATGKPSIPPPGSRYLTIEPDGLESPTPESLAAAEDREAAATKADTAEQNRLAREAAKAREQAELSDRTRQDASADAFELGQSRADVVKAMAGNGDLFAQPAPAAPDLQPGDIVRVTTGPLKGSVRSLIRPASDGAPGWVVSDTAAGEKTVVGVEFVRRGEAADDAGNAVYEPDPPAYTGNYETDLFGNPLPEATRSAVRARSAGAGVRGNAQPTAALQDTPAPAGTYHVRTTVGSEVQRKLGASKIATPADAAAATRYLYKSAVERFDGLVTDAKGKPLAVIGGFKGALSQASVYPSTLIGEAVRVPGAAKIWFSHNHPSGMAALSRADEFLSATLYKAFKGSGIEPQGLLAIAGGEFAFHDGSNVAIAAGDIPDSTSSVSVPAIERVLAENGNAGMPLLDSPTQSKRVAKEAYDLAQAPGILLLDSQNRVSAWVPLPHSLRGKLSGTGGLNAIMRAVSESNAAAAIIVHAGELDTKAGGPNSQTESAARNIGAALLRSEVRVLDIIHAEAGASEAERGGQLTASMLFSQGASAPFYSELSRHAERASMNAAPASGWLSWLKGLPAKGIKPDEIAWSGIEEFLAMQTGKVTKQQVLDFINANGVKVTETVLGGKSEFNYQGNEWQAAINSAEAAGDFDLAERINRAWEGIDEETGSTSGMPKHSKYQLPGGTNYREVLLTLPPADRKPRFDVVNRKDKVIIHKAESREDAQAWIDGHQGVPAARGAVVVERSSGQAAAPEYKSSHWDQPNVLAHVRLNDRTDSTGAKTLFVEEIQSDWGQAGKKKGFGAGITEAELGARKAAVRDMLKRNDMLGFDTEGEAFAAIINEPDVWDLSAEDRAIATAYNTVRKSSTSIPAAPFVGKTDAWVALALKRIVKMAVDEGYDRVAFINGEQSAARYDLSKQVDSIVVVGRTHAGTGEKTRSVRINLPNTGQVIDLGVDNNAVIDNTNYGDYVGKPLADVIGKEMAEKVMKADTGTIRGGVTFSGIDLKVGGEGMKAFYDRIVPSTLKDVLRKVGGGAPEAVSIGALREISTNADDGAGGVLKRREATGGVLTQPGFTITPAMREKAAGGLPLFAQGRTADQPSTVASANAEIASLFGKSAERVVTVAATVDALPPSIAKLMREANATAVTIDKRHIYIVADRAAQGTVRGLVMHELGVHYGMDAKQIAQLTAQVKRWAAGTGTLAEQARWALKAAADSSSTNTDEEALAYMVQVLVDSGVSPAAGPLGVRRLLNLVLAALKRAARALGLTFDMTPQDIVDYAYGAAKMALRHGPAISAESRFADASQFSEAGPAANPDIRFSAASYLKSLGGGEQIAGQTTRAYTPAQIAAFKGVGFQTTAPTLEERARSLWQGVGKKLAQGLVDQFAPIKELDTKAYGLMRLAKGASGAFEVMLNGGKLRLNDGVYDFDETARGGVIDTLLKPLQGEHHDFLRWVAANRAERLTGEGKERLFSPSDIAALKTLTDGVTDFDYTIQTGAQSGTTTRDRTLIYADALRVFNGFNKNVLDLAEQSGLIDVESRAIWEHEFYVPFYRVTDDSGIRGMNIKGGVVRQQAFKQLKGGRDKLNTDLLENTLMNWAHLLDASAKNRAAKATLEAAERMGGAIPADEATAREMANSTGQRKGVVWFRDGGAKRFYFVDDPYLLTAISALEFAGMNSPIMKAMGAFKHALTIGVTASPFFKVRNLIRDSVQAIGTSPLGYNPVANIAAGWQLTDPKSDAHFRLLAGGGTIHFGTMMEGSEARRVQALVESGVDASTILGGEHKLKAFYRKVIEPAITAYNELGNRGEAINRASLYAQLIKQGKGHAEASLMARDLMDFSMQGSFTSIRFLSQVVPFFNARIQGMYKLGRGAKEDPRKFAAVLGAVTLLSVGLLAAYSDDDDWKKREDWDRNTYWWFKIGGVAFRIPKPFEIGAMATLAERGFELAFDKEMTSKRFRQQVMTLLGDNLSMNPIPQLVKPIMDVYANRDSFTGRPIESMGMEKMAPEYRFNSRTSMTARAASTAANAVTSAVGAQAPSPLQIDHLLRGYFGWLGAFVVGAADVIARPVANEPGRASPDYWKAVTGGMVSDVSDAPSRYVTQVYAQAKEVEQAYATWRALTTQGKAAEAAIYLQEHRQEIAQHRFIERIKRGESRLNRLSKTIEDSDRPADEKRAMLRQINEQKDRIARVLAPTD